MASDDPEVIITEEQAGAVNHRVVKQGKRILRGFDAELAQKHIDSWDPELEQKALDWIYAMTGERCSKITDLRSGIVLCMLANRIRAGIIPRYNQGPTITPLHERDNIRLYLDACRKLGVPGGELFMVEDLYEEKFLPGVLKNLYSLGRLLQMRTSWFGPKLEAIRAPAWLATSEDSIEPLVRQVAQSLSLPATTAETALTILAAQRVRSHTQLYLLCSHEPLWNSLPISPPEFKRALWVASRTARLPTSRASRWHWLLVPLVLTGIGVVLWRSPRAMRLLRSIRIET